MHECAEATLSLSRNARDFGIVPFFAATKTYDLRAPEWGNGERTCKSLLSVT